MLSPWTPDKDRILRGMRGQGDSFGLIANAVGLSRNACIGRASRLDLPKKTQTLKAKVPRVRKNPARSTPAQKIQRARARLEDGRLAPRVSDLTPAADFLGVSLLALEHGICRFPRGDSPFTFCGQPAEEFSSYCRHCYDLTHVPTPPRRPSRAYFR